jgi:deoxyribonuclease V
MILAVDVNYRESIAVSAGVLFQNWGDSDAVGELTVPISMVSEYVPGQFCRRELPCVLELLKRVAQLPEYIISPSETPSFPLRASQHLA